MTLLSVNYRCSGSLKPLFLKNADIEEIARVVRTQLVSPEADALPLALLRDITSLKVNGLGFDLWVSLDHPVTDHATGEQVCGLCEFDPGAGEDAVSLLVSPVGDGMTEELVLSTFGHELGHAVFDAPGWLANAKSGPGLFDAPEEGARTAYRTTTRDADHLSGAGAATGQNGSATVTHETERHTEMRIAEYRANEFMGSLLVPRQHLIKAVMETAQNHDITLICQDDLLAGEAPASLTIKAKGVLGEFDLESLQKAIGRRFGVHGRFIRVRMERYGLLPGSRPH